MAWTYSAWPAESTDTARLSMLRLHIAEVSAEFGPDTSRAGVTRSNSAIPGYLDSLHKQAERLERKAAIASGSGFTRGRPV